MAFDEDCEAHASQAVAPSHERPRASTRTRYRSCVTIFNAAPPHKLTVEVMRPVQSEITRSV